VIDGIPYSEMAFELGPGDAVVIASDGITGARDASGNEYGTAQVKDVLRRTEAQPARLGEGLLASVKAYSRDHRFQDDVVVVCFGRNLNK
jgi:serine phosphatase RsbU (regulator of sigma subunit)